MRFAARLQGGRFGGLLFPPVAVVAGEGFRISGLFRPLASPVQDGSLKAVEVQWNWTQPVSAQPKKGGYRGLSTRKPARKSQGESIDEALGKPAAEADIFVFSRSFHFAVFGGSPTAFTMFRHSLPIPETSALFWSGGHFGHWTAWGQRCPGPRNGSHVG